MGPYDQDEAFHEYVHTVEFITHEQLRLNPLESRHPSCALHQLEPDQPNFGNMFFTY